jgi:sarcosine oxidase subunit alpha
VTARRLPGGGRIDRGASLGFTWDGKAMHGCAGDSLASALLANGVRVVGRGFKYHRPRGIFGAWAEEPNAIVDLTDGDAHDANARATLVELREGMRAAGVNAAPDVAHDRYGAIDLLHEFLPAGFYYKTFMPNWHRYEPRIRAMAGLGRARTTPETRRYVSRSAHCDVLVAGGGPAGLAAARAAASSGASVILADDHWEFGGSLLWRGGFVDNQAAADWAQATVAALARDGVRLLVRTTVFGAYDHNAFGLLECVRNPASGFAAERLWHVRARQVVFATGAIERPLVFPQNDRPGVMSAAAVLEYLRRYAVLPGESVVVATNNDSAYEVAVALREAGAAVTLTDVRATLPPAARAAEATGVRVLAGSVPLHTAGRSGVAEVHIGRAEATSLKQATTRVMAEVVAVSGGWSPAVHLHSQAGGKLRWDDALATFLPREPRPAQHHAGALARAFSLADALASGHSAGVAAARALDRRVEIAPPRAPAAEAPAQLRPYWRVPIKRSRQWLDFQNDVTVKDVALAARENYSSVEHLKRYTTLGMATDQGKTSNVNGLAVLADETAREIPQVGTTTFRPPFVPVSFGALAGLRHGKLYSPWRRVPAHADHEAMGADIREYGGWFRPACYPRDGETAQQAIQREAQAVRSDAGVFDASSLGKIVVDGPDAASFLNPMFYNEVANLKPGRIRYALLLRETGIVYDDGVVSRLADERFLLSPSSSHTTGVLTMLEQWRQTEYPQLRVAIHDTTASWATFAVAGPRARELLAPLTDIDLSLPHMSLAHGTIGGVAGRIARVSFTGERSYEVSVPARFGPALWHTLLAAGATPYGVETSSLLRAEKGYILIGVDTDGMTLPDDLGMAGPLRSKKVDFVGKRSLMTPDATRPDRRQFCGLLSDDPEFVPPVGAHAIERGADGRKRSLGWVTSAYYSPALGRGIALGMIERGRALTESGAVVECYHLGKTFRAKVASPVFYDPTGERLHG